MFLIRFVFYATKQRLLKDVVTHVLIVANHFALNVVVELLSSQTRYCFNNNVFLNLIFAKPFLAFFKVT